MIKWIQNFYVWLNYPFFTANTKISLSIVMTYTVFSFDRQRQKLRIFSRKACHLRFSSVRDSLFWCLASPVGAPRIRRQECLCAFAWEVWHREACLSLTRIRTNSLSLLCKHCAVEGLSIRGEINSASPTEHVWCLSLISVPAHSRSLLDLCLPGDKTAWQYLSPSLFVAADVLSKNSY